MPAAGRGERYGSASAVPKQFQPVAGRPLLVWTLERLLAAGVPRLVVALPADWRAWAADNLRLSTPGGSERLTLIAGGESRQESVERSLAAAGHGDEDDLVLVHDGARPVTALADVRTTVLAAAEHGAAVLGRRVDDTLKRLDGGWLGPTVPRDGLFRAETPQVFRRSLLLRGYAAARASGRLATDEAGVIELLGDIRIRAVTATAPNPKLTHAGDHVLVAALLAGAGGDFGAPS